MFKEWPNNPDIYEINTRLWLRDLSVKYNTPITLGTVPEVEIAALSETGFDALWLMGVWSPSPASTRIARTARELYDGYLKALPDLQEEDIAASPYAVKEYVVNPAMGGEKGLKQLRAAMKKRGLKLILDFVPNHVSTDHPWILSHPDYFIRGDEDDLEQARGNFFNAAPEGQRPLVIAHGKDPYFPGWTDTAQLNYFHPGLREQMIKTLLKIAGKCDGLRCDMAMLILNEIHYNTWGERLLWNLDISVVPDEFWRQAIKKVKTAFPHFLFIAEAYWMKEGELQGLGFDYTYDKALYDWLKNNDVLSIKRYIIDGPRPYQERCLRFIENHDEERAKAVFGAARERSAALLTGTLPGAHLYHEGQLEGAAIKYPVQLARRRCEKVDEALREYYRVLIKTAKSLRKGHCQFLEAYPAWEGNYTHHNFIIYLWQYEAQLYLVVINLAPERSQCYVPLPHEGIEGNTCSLIDLLDDNRYERDGDILASKGLYLDMEGFYRHLFHIESQARD